ncbi:MAG TPA: hypothetical protein VGE30_02110 [Candidatus Saccharimonadales bacterium]
MKPQNDFFEIFKPSWVVNFLGLTLGILVTGAAIVLSQYRSSELSTQIFAARSEGGVSLGVAESISNNITDNGFLNALPLMLVWAAAGLVVYFLAAAIIRSFGQAAQLREELEYVHVTRQDRIREALQHVGIRVLVVIAWFVFLQVTLHALVPYALAAANIASQSFSLQSAGYAALAVVVIYAMVWAQAVFFRLFMLRTRVFGRA